MVRDTYRELEFIYPAKVNTDSFIGTGSQRKTNSNTPSQTNGQPMISSLQGSSIGGVVGRSPR